MTYYLVLEHLALVAVLEQAPLVWVGPEVRLAEVVALGHQVLVEPVVGHLAGVVVQELVLQASVVVLEQGLLVSVGLAGEPLDEVAVQELLQLELQVVVAVLVVELLA